LKLLSILHGIVLLSLCTFNALAQEEHIPWPSLADSPWPVTRGDMQATGRSKFVGPRTNNVIWRKDMPLGILYGPVIGYGDVLYFGERALSPDSVNYFYAVESNGNPLWTFETETPFPNNSGAIVTSDSTIYFFSRNQKMHALNPDGTLKWTQDIWANLRPFYPVAKNGDIFVVMVDTVFVVSPGGQIKNSFLVPFVNTSMVFSTGGDTLFYTSGQIQTTDPQAVNAMRTDGTPLWSVFFDDFTGKNRGIPVVDNSNRIYLNAKKDGTSYLYCINPDGSTAWRYPFKLTERFENNSSITLDSNGNILFQISTNDSGYIASVNSDGQLNWKTVLGHYYDDGAFINHALVCDAEGKVYCGSNLGPVSNFWCLDSNGVILWDLSLEGYELDSSPAIGSDGTLYIGTHISSLFTQHERNLIAIKDVVSGTGELDANVNKGFELLPNYPNPFNPQTEITFQLPQSEFVTLNVFDVTGRLIRNLIKTRLSSGTHKITWDGMSKSGNPVGSGIYFYRLETAGFTKTRKMILIR